MMIESFQTEKLKDLPVGTYSLYSGRVGVSYECIGNTATVTLAQWLDKPPTSSKHRLSQLNPVAKFKVTSKCVGWQLPLLEEVLQFANDGKVDRVFRFISLGAPISSHQHWAMLKNNCRLIREEKERGLINA